jgi:hypothetical protein
MFSFFLSDSPRSSYLPPPSPSCSSGAYTDTEFVFPHYCHHPMMSPNEDMSRMPPRTPARITRRHRIRLSSTGEEDGEDVEQEIIIDESRLNLEEHLHLMAARERLQEFPGRVPKKKKVNTSSANQFNTARNSCGAKAIVNKVIMIFNSLASVINVSFHAKF